MTADPGSGTPMSERMQALLSRAVEDQLSEQRQLAGALAEVRGQLARIAAEMETIRGETGPAPDVEHAVAAVSAEVRAAVRLLGERLDGVDAALARLAERVEALDRGPDPRVDELSAEVEDLHDGLFGDHGLGPRLTGALADLRAGLAEHVDEAVLALAEALLRRRARPRAVPEPEWAPSPADAPPPATAEPAAEWAERPGD